MDGVYASASMKDKNQFNAADNRRSDNTFSLKNFNEARFQLGDRYRDLATVVVHSNILKELQNANINYQLKFQLQTLVTLLRVYE